jgi:hypothetical protein
MGVEISVSNRLSVDAGAAEASEEGDELKEGGELKVTKDGEDIDVSSKTAPSSEAAFEQLVE